MISFPRLALVAGATFCLIIPRFATGVGAPSANVKVFYKPVDAEFWKEVERGIAKKNLEDVFKIEKPEKGQGGEVEEWKIGMARALVAAGQPLHAQYLLSNFIQQVVATRQSFEGLRFINEIAKSNSIDESLMEDVAFDLDTKLDDANSRAMIGYFRARALLKKGYADWANQALKDVGTGTTWLDELEFDRTLQILSSGDAATAYGRFESIAKSPNARKGTVKLARLALARLIFERRDYKAAISMYLAADLPVRERARSLNELAWSYYYDQQYGKALGIIHALRTYYFERLFTPETAVLEMLIYRELCHYDRVHALADEFQKTFSDVYKAVENRLPLENIVRIMQTSLQEGALQKRATVIQQLRIERRELLRQNWTSADIRDELVKFGEKRERTTELEIQRILREKVDGIANQFLDLREQVWYLDYEASLRLIQMAESASPDYVPPEKSTGKPNDFFWPADSKEAWRDELLDYELLVRGKCQANGGEK